MAGARVADDRCLVRCHPTDTGEAGGGEHAHLCIVGARVRDTHPVSPFISLCPHPHPLPLPHLPPPHCLIPTASLPPYPPPAVGHAVPFGRELRLPCLQPECIMRQATRASYDACRRTNRPRHWQRRARVCSAGWGNGGWNIGVEAPPARPLTVSAVSKRRRSKERRTGRREEGEWHICIDQRAPDAHFRRVAAPRIAPVACAERKRHACIGGGGGRGRGGKDGLDGAERPPASSLRTTVPLRDPAGPRHDRVSTLIVFPFYFRARLPLLVFPPGSYDLLHVVLSLSCSFSRSKRPRVPVIAAFCIPGGRRTCPPHHLAAWREVEDTSRVMGGGEEWMPTSGAHGDVSRQEQVLSHPPPVSSLVPVLLCSKTTHRELMPSVLYLPIPIHLTFLQRGLKMQEK
ncbi:hypothetical protein B0H14DRAFT_55734 [Mycena olivaceomarginata]|nr:hypothetical protein B0H14DRAFT_55734 [Mycena olivaceomarginata]